MAKAKKPKFDDIDVKVTKLNPPFPPEWPQGYQI